MEIDVHVNIPGMYCLCRIVYLPLLKQKESVQVVTSEMMFGSFGNVSWKKVTMIRVLKERKRERKCYSNFLD